MTSTDDHPHEASSTLTLRMLHLPVEHGELPVVGTLLIHGFYLQLDGHSPAALLVKGFAQRAPTLLLPFEDS